MNAINNAILIYLFIGAACFFVRLFVMSATIDRKLAVQKEPTLLLMLGIGLALALVMVCWPAVLAISARDWMRGKNG